MQARSCVIMLDGAISMIVRLHSSRGSSRLQPAIAPDHVATPQRICKDQPPTIPTKPRSNLLIPATIYYI